MRRLTVSIAYLFLATLLLAAPGCNRQRRQRQAVTVEETGPGIASTVNVADPRTAIQLLKGFHEVEQNAWRWTRSQFSVTLKVPPGAAIKGGVLEVKIAVPDPVIQRLKSVTLSANAGGVALAPETYSAPGDQIYRRDIAASALSGDAVTIDFSLDKFLAAGAVDGRELGIIVSSLGLATK